MFDTLNEYELLKKITSKVIEAKHFDYFKLSVKNEVNNKRYNYTTLILEGGGIKGIAYIGVLKALEELNQTNSIKRIIGTSVGSIFAALIAMGYTSNELDKIIRDTDFNKLLKPSSLLSYLNVFKFIFKYGYNSTSNLEKWIKKLIKDKIGNENINQKQLYDITKKDLVITTVNLNKRILKIWENNNSIPIYKLLVASACIPIWFKPYIIDNEYYCDGGLIMNYNTFSLNQNEKFIGCRVDTKDEINIFNNKFNRKINSISNYLYSIYYSFTNGVDISNMNPHIKNNTIFINSQNVSCFDTDISGKQITDLINESYIDTYFFINEKLKN